MKLPIPLKQLQRRDRKMVQTEDILTTEYTEATEKGDA